MSACLLLLPGTVGQSELLPMLQEARSSGCSRVYVSLQGPEPDPVCQHLLDWLSELYAAVGQLDPRWEVIPCLQAAGWTQELLAAHMPDVQALLAAQQLQQAAEELQRGLNSSRAQQQKQGSGTPVELRILPKSNQQQHVQQQQGQEQGQQQAHRQEQQHQQGQQQAEDSSRQLQHSRVAVGGTFDRLHAGHRLLLAATALVATQHVYVGITADNLLAKKSNKHLLQDYEARRAAAVDFMALVRPGLAISDGALADPQEPTQAELDPAMEALVVSAETLVGGQAINEGRKARGFAPVHLVVVGLVGGNDASSKLSSTALRQADASVMNAQQ